MSVIISVELDCIATTYSSARHVPSPKLAPAVESVVDARRRIPGGVQVLGYERAEVISLLARDMLFLKHLVAEGNGDVLWRSNPDQRTRRDAQLL